jgi:hypothetical protein
MYGKRWRGEVESLKSLSLKSLKSLKILDPKF